MRMTLFFVTALVGVAVFAGTSLAQDDCNDNGIPDECDISCAPPGCEKYERCGLAPDCDSNGIPDECEGEPFKFKSGKLKLEIPDNDPEGLKHTIDVPQSGNIADVSVRVKIIHTFIGDLTIDVEHDGIVVRLWDLQCGEDDDLKIIFDDDGDPVVCATPTVGRFQPVEPLDAFNNGDLFGDWTLTVVDNFPENLGTLVEWGISGTLRKFDCCVGDLVEADPPDGAIDAREEHKVFEPENLTGLTAFVVTFDDDTSIVRQCFYVEETGGGEPPKIVSIEKIGGNRVRVNYDRTITVQEWTTLAYEPRVGPPVLIDVGFLPGDVNQLRQSNGRDISDLIDCLAVPGDCADYQTDINRSGDPNGGDITDLIDLLQASAKYPREWLNQTIIPEPHP